jgi:S1-C subfamily serine protease
MGTVPDFTYDGQGYRISAITPGSPAEQAGLRPGDIIVRCGDTPIDNVRAFAEVLKTLQPDAMTTLTFIRDGSEHTVQTRVVAR